MSADRQMGEFLQALGSGESTPGGGAACALVGALAVALAEMVAQFTVGRPRFQDVNTTMRATIEQAQTLRADLVALIDDDARAFASVSAAYRLPKGSDAERETRTAAIHQALGEAMEPPLRVMALGCQALALVPTLAEAGNPTVASDAGCAALLGEAAVRAAALNVLANVVLLPASDPAASAARAQVTQFEQQAAALCAQALAATRTRMGA